jgi:hypothetical protein
MGILTERGGLTVFGDNPPATPLPSRVINPDLAAPSVSPNPMEAPGRDWSGDLRTALQALATFYLAHQGGIPALAGLGAGVRQAQDQAQEQARRDQETEAELQWREFQRLNAIKTMEAAAEAAKVREEERAEQLADRQRKFALEVIKELSSADFTTMSQSQRQMIDALVPSISTSLTPEQGQQLKAALRTSEQAAASDLAYAAASKEAYEALERANGGKLYRDGKLALDPKLRDKTLPVLVMGPSGKRRLVNVAVSEILEAQVAAQQPQDTPKPEKDELVTVEEPGEGGMIRTVLRPKRQGLVTKTVATPKRTRDIRMMEDRMGRIVPHELNETGEWVPMKVKGWDDEVPEPISSHGIGSTPLTPKQQETKRVLDLFK